jgi:hypothetical protein
MRVPRILFGLVMALCVPLIAMGQSTFGSIVGVVKDPSQGAVAGAQITLVSADDHTQHAATTNTDGAFQLVNVKAGHYDLLVQAEGFAEYKRTGLQLDARQTLRADVDLKLASSSQTVEVAGDSGPVINTENATIGDSEDFLVGSGTTTIAAGVSKNFHITERMRLRFEGTFTNLLNHPNFAPPPTNVTASSFGIVQSVQTAENSGNRTGQLSLRLDF